MKRDFGFGKIKIINEKKIAILGSTGSIGENTLKIIKQDKKDFEIILLSTNKNLTKVLKQAKEKVAAQRAATGEV